MNNSDSKIDTYISTFPKDVQVILQKIRMNIRKSAPMATETISYGIPTFDLNGVHLVHFAAFKKHIGFFPTPSGIKAFKNRIGSYKTSKGTIQFLLDKPIPYDLISNITDFRQAEVLRISSN